LVQPRQSSTGWDTCGVLVGRETIALTPIEKYAATTPHIDTPKKYKVYYKKPPSGSHKKTKKY
jgi:hypothetical protein